MKSFKSRNGDRKIENILKTLIIACFIFSLGVLIYGLIISPDMSIMKHDVREYTEDWRYTDSSNNEHITKLPISVNKNKGESIAISTILPDDINDNTYICFLTGKSFTAYIDGVEIYNFDITPGNRLGYVVKSLYVPVPLKASYAGKEFVYIKEDLQQTTFSMNAVYIGDMYGILLLILKRRFLQFIMALLLSILSIAVVIVFRHIAVRENRKLPLVYLAEGVLCCSLWVLFDSFMFQIVFAKYFVDGVVGYLITLLLGSPFCFFLDTLQNGRYKKMYNIIQTYFILNFIICCILHFGHITSFEEMLGYNNGFLAAIIVVLLFVGITDAIKYKNEGNKYIIVGMISFFVCAIIEIITINFSVNNNYTASGSYVLLGLFILLSSATIDQVHRLNVMQAKTREAVAATKAKSDFLANMSHEIRTPINAIMGMNEIILRESSEENVRECAKDIYTASNSLLELVNGILDFSKIESGKMEIEEVDYDIGEVISDVVSMISVKAKEKELKFIVDASKDIPSKLHGDDKRIEEVMINILNNAVKYTKRGVVYLHIDGKENKHDTYDLNFYVKDTGIGIKPEDMDKLFVDFERLEFSKNRQIEGTGLGLAITAKLVDMMGGKITVDSLYGSGSKFSITIPQRIVDNEPMGDFNLYRNKSIEEEIENDFTFTAPECRVLVVDDNNMNRTVMTKLLERTGIQVTTADSGERMLELIKENAYDVILLDHMMPQMDGLETIERAKKMADNKCLDAKYIALTANAIVGAKEIYIEAGFDDYLSKPVRPALLDKVLIQYLPKEKVIII